MVHGDGVDLLEAYGMTETTGLTSFTPPDRIRLGYSGAAVRGVEVRVGAGDEIQIRGPNVFSGYWKMPDKTAETLEGGWFRTPVIAAPSTMAICASPTG